PASGKGGRRVFLSIGDFLGHHARKSPDREAILAPGRSPLTYAALAACANDAVRCLRNLGVRRTDRVAMVLSGGAEASVAMISVAAAAVCVPFNPASTASELQRCFSDLRISALVTRPDVPSMARDVAHTLGVPVIDDLPLRPDESDAAGRKR